MATDGRRSVGPTVEFGELGATLDTDGTLSANSDEKVPSQQAVKEYVDNEVAGGGGGGLSQGALNQLFAASPSQYCDPSGVNAGAITATVVVTAGNAVLTCSADASAYFKQYSVVGTAAQAGKAAFVDTVSADGLTITCQGIGENNPLVTDATPSQLKFYGGPTLMMGNPDQAVTSTIYSTPDGTVHIEGHGYWTGPMFNAGPWTQFGGTIGGYVMPSSGGMKSIQSITDHALVLDWNETSLPDNTAATVIATINATTYIAADFELVISEDGTTKTQYYAYRELFGDDASVKDGDPILATDVITGGGPGVTLSEGWSGSTWQLKAATSATGNARTIRWRVSNKVPR